MKIAMVANHGCVRVWKEAQMLMDEGHTVAIITQKLNAVELDRWYIWMFYNDEKQLKHAIQECDKAGYEIFHVHNEPDWIVKTVRNSTLKPVIFDIHDLESARIDVAVPKDEIEIIRSVDGIINVSESMTSEVEYWHNPKCPMITLFTYSPKKMFLSYEEIFGIKRIPNSIVYEGSITEPFAIPEGKKDFCGRKDMIYYSFRDYGHIFKRLIEAGMEIHIYACDLKPELKGYEIIGCHIHPAVPFENLAKELSKYEWNFVGANTPIPLLNKAMPNKLFEPMAGGCVPVVYCAKEAEKFVLKNQFGINIDVPDIDEIKEKMLNKIPIQYRKNFYDRREEFTMEIQYDKLIKLYEDAFHYNSENKKKLQSKVRSV